MSGHGNDSRKAFGERPFLGADEPERFGAQIEEHLRRTELAGLFLQSPAFMAVTRGPDHVLVNANPTYYDLVGSREIIGRPVREAFPELEGQGFLERLDEVYRTGEPHVGSEAPVRLERDGARETLYVCFGYHPLKDDDGEVWGTLMHGVDVTERVRSREELEARLRAQMAVAELGRRALEDPSPEPVASEAVRTAVEATSADAGELLLRRPEAGELAVAAVSGWDAERADALVLAADGDHQPGRVLSEGRPLFAGPRSTDAPEAVSPLEGEAIHLTVAVPAADGEDPLGVLAVHAADPEAFDETSVPALEAIANVVSAVHRLRESARFITTVARNLPGFLYRCRDDRAWTMEFVSDGAEATTGHDPSELVGPDGTAFGDLIHPDDRERVWREVQAAIEEERPFQLEYRIRTRGGDVRRVWEQGRAVGTDGDGGAVLEGYIVDVTEWREAREEAARATSLVDAVLQSLSDAVFVVRASDRTIAWCNRAVQDMFGFERSELLDEPTRKLHVDEETSRRFGEMVFDELDREGVFRADYEMRRKDGSTFPTEHVVTYVDDGDGDAEHLVSIVRDISDRRERERELRRSHDLLRRYSARLTRAREEERRRIAREVHDELGQNLTALKIRLDEALRDADERGVAAEMRNDLEEGLELVRSTIEQVRELATSLHPGILDQLGLVDALERLARQFGERTGIRTFFDPDREAADLGAEERIHVYRVIQEALTNAARHGEPEHVRVEVRTREGRLILRVLDDGKGLSGDPLDAEDSQGVIGMRERAHLLGGELEIADRPEGGVEVRLTVPAAETTA